MAGRQPYMIIIMSDEIIEQLAARAARRRTLAHGTHLFHQDDPVTTMFVVEDGLVELIRRNPQGAPIVLQRAAAHTVLAEASAYSQTYHCDAVAVSRSSVLELPKRAFLQQLRDDAVFAALWASHLAAEVQSARYRSEILAQKTVAERLDAWLAWRGAGLPVKGEWKTLAAQIGVSPEALYRELAKRRHHPYMQ